MFNNTKAPPARTGTSPSVGSSVIGPTLKFIGGELSSDEDLIIEGTVEGTIAHQNHQLTIGETGRVKADVHARVIIIEGALEGDMQGDEAVHIRGTARVIGNVTSPKVSIADGASFDGNVKTSVGSSGADLRGVKKHALLPEFAGSVGVESRRKSHADDQSDSEQSGESRQVTR